LIRYQARQAEEQSREPMPLATLSLNGFQDAVESMLSLVCEHHQIPRQRRTDFDKLFDAVGGTFPDLNQHREPAINLNNARVNFKHHANLADQRTIEQRRDNAMAFLREASKVCLGQDFDAISMVTLVRDHEARGHLETAGARWASGDKQATAQELRLAFDRLVRDYEQRKIEYPGKTLFTTQPSVFLPEEMNEIRGSKLGKFVRRWLAALDERSRLLALRIDLRGYAIFNAYCPAPFYTLSADGPPGHTFVTGVDQVQLDDDAFQRCHMFVVETALTLGAED
jgi:hypothetical protein